MLRRSCKSSNILNKILYHALLYASNPNLPKCTCETIHDLPSSFRKITNN